jgi:hypothetical protein
VETSASIILDCAWYGMHELHMNPELKL